MFDKYIYIFLDKVMEWSGKINSWAWVKHLKYVEKRREEMIYTITERSCLVPIFALLL